MQLTRALVAAAVMVAAGSARAQEPATAEGSLRIYSDDDRVTVITPSASAHASAGPVDLDLSAGADVISAASVDVLTSASPAEFEDRRLEGSLTGGLRLPGRQLVRLGGAVSHEKDYDSLRARAGWRAELARRNTTIDLDYAAGIDRAGKTGDPAFSRRRTDHQLTGTLTQLIDRRTYADLVIELRRTGGYQASPYRTVLLVDPASPELMMVDEVTPSVRMAGAALGRVRRAIGARPWFVHGWYRFYGDDWGVLSHTAGVQLYAEVRGALAGLSLRGYHQNAADFHRARYTTEDGIPALRTADRALGGMDSVHLGLTCELPAGAGNRMVGSLGALHLRFADSPAQESRTALLLAVGFRRLL